MPQTRPMTAASAPPLERQAFRDAMGRFVTGVAVATTRSPSGEPIGVTINSFTSVSLDPPLVLFFLDRRARPLPSFPDPGFFAVHALPANQHAPPPPFPT